MLSIWHSNLVYTCLFSMLGSFSHLGILSSSTRRIRWWKLPQCNYHVDFRGHKRLASHKILGISYLETTCLKSAVYYYKVQYKNGGGRHGISVIFLYLSGQRQGGRGDIQTTLRHFLKVSVKVLEIWMYVLLVQDKSMPANTNVFLHWGSLSSVNNASAV